VGRMLGFLHATPGSTCINQQSSEGLSKTPLMYMVWSWGDVFYCTAVLFRSAVHEIRYIAMEKKSDRVIGNSKMVQAQYIHFTPR